MIYRSCPTQKGANAAWKHFVKKNGKRPMSITKLPNNFRSEYSVETGAWGLWVADYGDWKDHYNPIKSSRGDPVRNVFSFIRVQSVLTDAVDAIKP